MESKDKQIRELRKAHHILFVVALIGILILGGLLLSDENKINELKEQLQSCQENLPDELQRHSVLAYKCGDHLYQIIVDKNNRIVFDYQIMAEKNCEVLE